MSAAAGFLLFLAIFTMAFWLLLFLAGFMIPYWITINLKERFFPSTPATTDSEEDPQ
ncbi:MAG: hypothetical protein AAGB22_08195 [Bacteroidota bacterium]